MNGCWAFRCVCVQCQWAFVTLHVPWSAVSPPSCHAASQLGLTVYPALVTDAVSLQTSLSVQCQPGCSFGLTRSSSQDIRNEHRHSYGEVVPKHAPNPPLNSWKPLPTTCDERMCMQLFLWAERLGFFVYYCWEQH